MKQITMILMVLTLTVPALARDRGLLDGALNESFKDHSQVQRSYGKNDGAVRPKAKVATKRAINIEVGDAFGSSGFAIARGGSEEGLQFRANGAEEEIEINVDQEMTDVNASLNKEAGRDPGSLQTGK